MKTFKIKKQKINDATANVKETFVSICLSASKRFMAFFLMISMSFSAFVGVYIDNVFAEGDEQVVSEVVVSTPEPVLESVSEALPEPVLETLSSSEETQDPVYSTSDIQPTSSSGLLESTIDPVDVISEDSPVVTSGEGVNTSVDASINVDVSAGADAGAGPNTGTGGAPSSIDSSVSSETLQGDGESGGQVHGTSTESMDTESDLEINNSDDDKEAKVNIETISTGVEIENYTDYDAKTKVRSRVKIKKSRLLPSKEFRITLTGRRIATKNTTMSSETDDLGPNSQSKKGKKGKAGKENRNNLYTASEAEIKLITSEVDTDSGNVASPIESYVEKISVSGACSQKYYVILLYKNLKDYEENPASYILNKAFECTNDTYNYYIDELPKTLEKGPYYLMVGQQDEGTWTPLTSLNEINIQ